jgi:hypothetical protein
MSDDNNALKDVDLSAWDVPAPERSAEELADDVIAVAGGTDIGAAIPVEGPVSTRKRAMLIAGVAAAVIALTAGAWVIVRGAKHAAPRDGSVIAEKAQALELDAAHADLDPGADVRWTRKGSVLRVEQRAGSAAWHVGSDSKLVIEAGTPGAALASVDASGASLRVEVKPMNAADIRIAGTVATTAAAVALVTVVVYEGHVKVRDNGTQQTVIVQPGTTYTVTPRPEPMPIVDDDSTFDDGDSVVGVAPVGADEPPELTIVAGDDVFIHDMSPPARVKIDMTKACRNGKVDLVVNGVSTMANDTLAFNRGNVKYSVLCDDFEVAHGAVSVTRDSLVRPLPTQPPMHSIYADGRAYSISYQQPPALEVHGGPGTLHVASGAVEKTYEARGESVLIPSKDLGYGEYKLWFVPDEMTTVNIAVDTAAAVVALASPISWGAQLQLEGSTLPGSTLTVEGISIPVDGQGRFKAVVPGGGDTLVMRIDHAQAGLHYAIARSTMKTTTPPTPVTVSQTPGMLDRGSIMKTMTSLRKRFVTCGEQHPQTARTTVKAKVFVEPNGRVSKTELTSTADPKLNVCLNDVISSATFPGASDQTVFTYPLIIEPPLTTKVVPPGTCDPTMSKEKGMENVNMGQHAAALAQFEASLRCKDDQYVRQLAFMSACNAQNAPKAKLYWNKFSKAEQDKFEPICVRNRIDVRKLAGSASGSDTDLAPANCDAEALKDKGMQNVDLGQHATALKLFEQSLACKQDSYVEALAFMTACSAQDAAKARRYYTKLTPPQQSKYKVMCIRNHIDPSQPSDDDEVYDDTDAKGYLQVLSKPTNAKILVDGVDSGLTTPIKGKKLALTPGKHKITYVIGDDRFTYPVNIQPGKTELMSKDLR